MKKTRIVAVFWFVLVLIYFINDGGKISFALVIVTIFSIILSIVLVSISGNNMELKILGEDKVNKDQLTEVNILVINKSRIPIANMECEVEFRNLLTGEILKKEVNFSIKRRGKDENPQILRSIACGCVDITVKTKKVMDPLKLFSKKVSKKESRKIYILPEINHFNINREEINNYDMESYKYSSTKKGNDISDTFGIRQYAPGDSPKTIHWKLTGKMGDLVVRELGLPIENSLMIILNKRMTSNFEKESYIASRTLELMLSISMSLEKNEVHHTICWYHSSKDKFMYRKINREVDIYSLESEILEASIGENLGTTIEDYLENYENKNFANYIFITAQMEEVENRDINKLAEYGKVKTYIISNY